MAAQTEHFSFDGILFTTIGRKPIGGPRGQEEKSGISSAWITCKSCAHNWRASRAGPGAISSAVGGDFILTCPGCRQSETFNLSALTG